MRLSSYGYALSARVLTLDEWAAWLSILSNTETFSYLSPMHRASSEVREEFPSIGARLVEGFLSPPGTQVPFHGDCAVELHFPTSC